MAAKKKPAPKKQAKAPKKSAKKPPVKRAAKKPLSAAGTEKCLRCRVAKALCSCPAEAPRSTRPEPITAEMTLGALAKSLGTTPEDVVTFLRAHMKPCAWNHTSIAVFQTSYFCAQDSLVFHESTCEAHADYAPCPNCGGKARRSGIRPIPG